jgi:hypothetical protein
MNLMRAQKPVIRGSTCHGLVFFLLSENSY